MAAIPLTHGHDDHVCMVLEVSEALRAPVHLHPADTIGAEKPHLQGWIARGH